ncbi:phosphotransferase [Pedobacter sp. MR2016-19]|uniref:phosphotransferase n=1 Tax=Pedobacter sp. MR2016-19 TaxID=2780089 RepID=UPI001873D4D0|nr:phosphotransferase [Pedobacter sp. MR2016-19]MBE5321372.1 phosphotransferase [Pedobacter sp. MR2016-19]
MNSNFSDMVINAAASLWGAEPQHKLNGTNHDIYKVTINAEPAVMRVTPVEHRDMDSVLGEIEFMQFMRGKVPVPKVIRSADNKLAEQLWIDGQQVIVCMFELIKGLPLNRDIIAQTDIIQLWGETMGSLRNFSRQYDSQKHYYRRLDGDVLINFAKQRIKKEPHILELLKNKWAEIQSSQLIQNEWGVIHGDLTQSNMHFYDNKLYMFDFDECMLAPYLYDIAITIHVTLLSLAGKDNYQTSGENFIKNFLTGYKKQCKTVVDTASLMLLMDFYNMLIYVYISQFADHPFKAHVLNAMKTGSLAGLDINKIICELNDKHD